MLHLKPAAKAPAPAPETQMIAGTVVTLSAAAVFSYLKVSRVLEKSAKCAAAHDSFRAACAAARRPSPPSRTRRCSHRE